ncbi:MAG: hypothetical protein ACR2FH_02760 [Caulobacteraceae bacterium]
MQPRRRQRPVRFQRLVLGPLTFATKARFTSMISPQSRHLLITPHPAPIMSVTVSHPARR